MKSFSQKTKENLSRAEFGKLCCCEAEIYGILMFAGRIKQDEIRVYSEMRATVERFSILLNKCFDVEAAFEENKNSFSCVVSDEKAINKIYEKFFDIKNGEYCLKNPNDVIKKECCRGSALRGAFLGGGTIVDPNKNYNMEFTTSTKEIADGVMDFLKEMSLNFRRTERKGTHVLYVKNSNVICDALTHMGAFGAQMEILNIKIERELRNDWNRTANGETANMDKVITAAIRQIRAIEKIEKEIGLDSLSDDLREIALLRKKNKDLSLEELGKMIYPRLSKSGVNHRLKKIIDIAEQLK